MPGDRCGLGEEGCLTSEDCQDGLECDRTAVRPKCIDIDECNDPRPWANTGPGLCGHNTSCTNTVGSFYCTCDSGYQNYQAGVGCTDINECGISEGINYCGSYTTCTNLPGTFHCDTDTCYPGYGGWRANYGCYSLLGASSLGAAQPKTYYQFTSDYTRSVHKGRIGRAIFVNNYFCQEFSWWAPVGTPTIPGARAAATSTTTRCQISPAKHEMLIFERFIYFL